MPEWFVEIQVSERDLRFLTSSLTSSDLSIFQEGEATFLRAPQFLTGTNQLEVHDSAVGLLEIINGAAKALTPSFDGLLFKSIGFRDEQGQMKQHYFLHVQSGYIELRTGGRNDPTLSEFVSLTTTIPAVAKALTLYGSLVHNWKNLYMVMEVIESDLGGESAVINSYSELTQRWKLCKRTANSFNAIGCEARHAKDFDAPSNPMQIEEAQELVRRVLYHWLMTKTGKGT